MRLNKYVALATGMSRRAADDAIANARIQVNEVVAKLGNQVESTDKVLLDGKEIHSVTLTTIMLNKPVGYVCSRDGQGNPTIYDLLPKQYHHLKPVGRLDKDSSGLLLLTNDGTLAYELTHPSFQKEKQYQVRLDRTLSSEDLTTITTKGVRLDDGPSKLDLQALNDKHTEWQVTMHEGRNRQIRRTFAAVGYEVTNLHRTQFGPYTLDGLPSQTCKEVS